jgi:dTDP-4-dehydrorhamnose reductase
MKYWITGAGGLLGQTLTHFFSAHHIPYVATTRQECDITKPEEVALLLEKETPSHVINCAAMTQVDIAQEQPALAYLINGKGPKYLAQACKTRGVKLIHISTDYLFSGTKQRPYLEKDIPDPINVYGKSKLEGEEEIQKIAPSSLIIRVSWLFGFYGSSFIVKMAQMMQEKERLYAADDQINIPTFCEDLASFIDAVKDNEGIVHFANPGPVSRYDLTCAIFSFMKNKVTLPCVEIVPVKGSFFKAPAPRPSYSALDTTKAEYWWKKSIPSWKKRMEDYLTQEFSHASL